MTAEEYLMKTKLEEIFYDKVGTALHSASNVCFAFEMVISVTVCIPDMS